MLHRQECGSDRLIVFFTGWGMDHRAAAHLDAAGYDVWSVADYTEPVELTIPARYRERHLVAWSLGVRAAAECGGEYTDALAVNGTLRPIDAAEGIAPEIFDGTIRNWPEERARERFMLRMTGSRAALEAFPRPERTADSQLAELRALAERFRGGDAGRGFYTRALIGTRDKIFPAAAQRNAWDRAGVPATEFEAPHAPFAQFHSWDEVLHFGED